MDFQRTINFRQNAKFVNRDVSESEGVLKIPHDGLPKDHMWKSRITEFLEFHHFTDIFKKKTVCGHFCIWVQICYGRFRADFAKYSYLNGAIDNQSSRSTSMSLSWHPQSFSCQSLACGGCEFLIESI